MELARVVGSVWATRKDASLDGARLLLIQPIDAGRRPSGAPLAAVDAAGAGPGEIVLFVTAYEAAIPWKRRRRGLALAATSATIVGVVDRVERGAEGAR